jgi:hypothetical protein
MSKLPSLADQIEKWKEMVKTKDDSSTDDKQTTWNPLDAAERVSTPSRETVPVPMSHSLPTVDEFLAHCCRSECGALANRILKKLLPSLQHPPSTYPLCSIANPDIYSTFPHHSGFGYLIPGVTMQSFPIFDASMLSDTVSSCMNDISRLNDNIVTVFKGPISTPNHLPIASRPGIAVTLHPSLPDFILEGIAHYLLQTVAIQSLLEDQEKIPSLTKEFCEGTIRSLAVASIYFAGKVQPSSSNSFMISCRLKLRVVILTSNLWFKSLKKFLFKLPSRLHHQLLLCH